VNSLVGPSPPGGHGTTGVGPATSDLDSDLEQNVQRAIGTTDRDYAVIAIVHRLPTVRNADRTYTVENGRVAESRGHEVRVDSDGTDAELSRSGRLDGAAVGPRRPVSN